MDNPRDIRNNIDTFKTAFAGYEEYYTVIGGTPYIIPFKMYAWMNNKANKADGRIVNDRDITKHKNDIFRLLPLLNPSDRVMVAGNVKSAVEDFLNAMEKEILDNHILGLRTKEESIAILREIYQIY